MTDFEQSLRDQLRSTERHLSPEIEARLRECRNTAVAKSSSFHIPRVLLPVAGMTMASIAAFFLVFSPLPPTDDQPGTGYEQVDAQELDFYYWLAETQGVVGNGA